MKSVLITGAAGFIGGAAVARFVEEGWHVLALAHRRTSPDLEALAARGAVTLLHGDAADASTFEAQLTAALQQKGMRLNVVVHAAGRASDVGRTSEFRRSHLESARVMTKLTRDQGADRMVLVSTTDVYGLRDFKGEGEDELPLAAFPANPYPENKLAAEKVLMEELPPERRAIVRPAAVWGKGDPTLTPRMVAFLRTSPWIVHFGSWRGRNRWPLAHVRNVAMTLYLTAISEQAGLVVNCLDDDVTTMDAFYRMVARIYLPGKSFKSRVFPFWVGRVFGSIVSALSNVLSRDRPIADPSHYAVYAVSRNLDFSNRRMKDLLAGAGRTLVSRDEGIRELETPP